MVNNKKVIIWTVGIDSLLNGRGVVGGLTVQMMQWAQVFVRNGWCVFSFSSVGGGRKFGLQFLYYPSYKFINFFVEPFLIFAYLIKVKPNLVLCRGASRSLYAISLFCRLCNVKVVFMAASDVNFSPGMERIPGCKINSVLYRKGVRHVDKVIVQNSMQATSLRQNYNKPFLEIPNIWHSTDSQQTKKLSVVWVGNFRELKRPEWFIRLAQKFPAISFEMAGGALDRKLYARCEQLASTCPNLNLHGPLSFSDAERIFDKARFLVCTSEYEGFPNTFLQAWARGIPIISTVDPSSLLVEKSLGVFVRSEIELYEEFSSLMENVQHYECICDSVRDYFSSAHNADYHYNKLMRFLK